MLDTTMRKQTQKHNTTYVGHHYACPTYVVLCFCVCLRIVVSNIWCVVFLFLITYSGVQHMLDTTMRKQTQKHNTTYVGHHYA
jgi:Flp pilus assembly protein TadB